MWRSSKQFGSSLGNPRQEFHPSVVLEGKVYSFGGDVTVDDILNHRRQNRFLNVYTLDPSTLRWRVVSAPLSNNNINNQPAQAMTHPRARIGHVCVSWRGQAYLFGGRLANGEFCTSLFRFDPKTNCWSRPEVTGVDVPPPMGSGQSACVIGDAMYVFRGKTPNHRQSRVYRLCFLSMTWNLLTTTGDSPGKPIGGVAFHSVHKETLTDICAS